MSEKIVLTEVMSMLIHDARISKGMKLADVCKYVGNDLDEPKLSRIENCKSRYIRIDHLKKLEELFDLQLNYSGVDIIYLQHDINALKQFMHERFGYQIDGNKEIEKAEELHLENDDVTLDELIEFVEDIIGIGLENWQKKSLEAHYGLYMGTGYRMPVIRYEKARKIFTFIVKDKEGNDGR